jgi:hypothetical protein
MMWHLCRGLYVECLYYCLKGKEIETANLVKRGFLHCTEGVPALLFIDKQHICVWAGVVG